MTTPTPTPTTPSISIRNILECTICLEVSASPIHNCGNGHILCGLCRDKVNKCGICSNENLVVSILGERLSRQYELLGKCNNYESGCKKPIKTTEIKEHLGVCDYRPVLCKQTNNKKCQEFPVDLVDFGKHLMTNHGVISLPNGNLTYFTVNATYSFINQDFPLILINHDNREFIWHVVHRQKIVYFWVTILGNKDDAGRYHFESELSSFSKDVKVPSKTKCNWKLPVFPYNGHSQFEKTNESVYGAVPSETISSLFLSPVLKTGKQTFQMSIKISNDGLEYNLDLNSALFKFKSLKLEGKGSVKKNVKTTFFADF